MPKDKDQVLVGVGALYAAPIGTAIPAHFAAPASPWNHVGYTEGGVNLEYSTEEAQIMVDQELDPVVVKETSRTLQISTTLAQVNKKNLEYAFGGGVVTPIDPDGNPSSGDEYDEYTPPDINESKAVALLFDGVDETASPVRFVIYEAKRVGGSSIQFQKSEKVQIAVTWRMLTPASSGAPFLVRVKPL